MDMYRQTVAELLRARPTPLEYLAFTAVILDGLSESEAAAQLTADLGSCVSRSMVHRAKTDLVARIRRAAAR